jgi:hypothetical protein
VEDDDNIQNVEFAADHAEGETNNDGVEEDTEFEDKEGDDFLAVGFLDFQGLILFKGVGCRFFLLA